MDGDIRSPNSTALAERPFDKRTFCPHRECAMRLRLVVIAGLLLAGGTWGPRPVPAQSTADSAAARAAARTAAADWLGWMGEREFEDSWEDAGARLRERQSRDAWMAGTKQLVDSLGTPTARTLTSATYRDSLRSDAGNGPFVVLTYRSSFAPGPYEEVLVLTPEDDDWMVVGYQVTALNPPPPPVQLSPRPTTSF